MFTVIVIGIFLVTTCGGQDVRSRFFTNGHGGYQFYHAQQEQDKHFEDQNLAESNAFNYIRRTTTPNGNVTNSVAKQVVNEEFKKSANKVTTIAPAKEDTKNFKDSLTKRRLFTGSTTTTSRPKAVKMRQRIIVRKYNNGSNKAKRIDNNNDKNRKREIGKSANMINSFSVPKYKLKDRINFKPTPKSKVKYNDAKSLFGGRKPSNTFMQVHLKKQNATVGTVIATTTLSPLSKSMKEKRHLANIRFFNRRKIRS